MQCDIYDLTFSPSFFENEVREGFFVSGMMKRYWASEMTVVSQIARICKKHEIPWFAVCGTLLGTVRHAGFVPWDDDFDIAMKRDDLQRFLEIAPGELPEGYIVYDIQTQPWYRNTIVRVNNSEKISLDNVERFHGCPYITGVDIFALDGIYRDPEKEADRRKRFAELKHAEVCALDEGDESAHVRRLLNDIEKRRGIKIRRDKDLQGHILAGIVKLFREVPLDDDVKGVPGKCEMFSQFYDELIFDTAWFDHAVWMPFENTQLPVPVRYQEVLRKNYGDFMRIGKGGGAHEYPAYSALEEMMREHIGANPFRYTFRPEHLSSERRPSAKENVRQMMALLEKVQQQAGVFLQAGATEAAQKLLVSAQTMAVKLGEQIEMRLGADASAVHAVEAYCEAVYSCFEAPGEQTLAQMREACQSVRDRVEKEYLEQKTVLFLAVKPSWWASWDRLYQAYSGKDWTVRVLCIPWYERNADLSKGKKHDESGAFPREYAVVPAEEADIATLQPDCIVTQFPFDGEDQAVLIDEAYYTSWLRNLTERLIYVQPYDIRGESLDSETAKKSLQILAEQPAPVYADAVVVADERVRQLFIDLWTQLAGEETKTLWEKKIISREDDDGRTL